MDRLPILESEIKPANTRMNRGKATGVDGVSVEIIVALEEFGVEEIKDFADEVYD